MKELANKLSKISYDLTAEAVVVDLLNKDIDPDSIIVAFEGEHKKNWDKDILKFDYVGDKLIMKLSRNGLFDSLPEYLFTKPIKGTPQETKKIAEFNKQQEKDIKILFNPVENELFSSKVLLEQITDRIFASFSTHNNQGLIDLWQIDKGLDQADQVKLCKMIPFLNSMLGDFQITSRCLEYFLDDKVSWEVENRVCEFTSKGLDTEKSLGGYSCGLDMILSGTIHDSVPTVVFTIGPVSGDRIALYLGEGKKKKLLNLFSQYFIPLHYEMDIKLAISSEDSEFTLENSYMGFNSTLG